jgi:hypothetical protein
MTCRIIEHDGAIGTRHSYRLSSCLQGLFEAAVIDARPVSA